ncbi:MAG: RNA polymerase sigma factor [Clostridia bacterium]|nr:RNA polymerase sigma factor [Clostridia bacterium]
MTNESINKYCDDALCRIADGDIQALSIIYDKLGRRIFLLALSILKDKESAEDIMQDTFVKIASEAHAYKENSNAVAFILTVTRNLSLNLLAKRRRNTTMELTDQIDTYATDMQEYAPKLSALEALSLLDDDERQIVIMKIDGKMKHKDIAPILGVTAEACQKRYRRALEKLKRFYI